MNHEAVPTTCVQISLSHHFTKIVVQFAIDHCFNWKRVNILCHDIRSHAVSESEVVLQALVPIQDIELKEYQNKIALAMHIMLPQRRAHLRKKVRCASEMTYNPETDSHMRSHKLSLLMPDAHTFQQ